MHIEISDAGCDRRNCTFLTNHGHFQKRLTLQITKKLPEAVRVCGPCATLPPLCMCTHIFKTNRHAVIIVTVIYRHQKQHASFLCAFVIEKERAAVLRNTPATLKPNVVVFLKFQPGDREGDEKNTKNGDGPEGGGGSKKQNKKRVRTLHQQEHTRTK